MEKIIAIIPARYNSTRFPGKILANIAGKPMIQHVYERARQIGNLADVIVATDNDDVLKLIQSIGGQAILTDQKHPSGTDRIAEAARLLKLPDSTIVVNIQGDQPLVPEGPVNAIIELLCNDPECHMSTAACPMDSSDIENPNRVKVVLDVHSRALYFSRSPIPYDRDNKSPYTGCLRHLGLYAYRHDFLQTFVELPRGRLESLEKLEQLRALEYGYKIGVALVREAPIDVDTEEDLIAAKKILADQ